MNTRQFAFLFLLTLSPLALGKGWVKDPNTGCELWAFGDSASWDGACVGGRASGRGTATFYEDGKPSYTYKGEMEQGVPNGQGVMTGAGGGRYEGQFKNSYADGQGIMTTPDGSHYEGQFKDGKVHGQGVATGPNGEHYEAQFKDGEVVDGTVVSGSSGSSDKRGSDWVTVWQRWVLTTSCVGNNDFRLTGGPSHVSISNSGNNSTLNSSEGVAGKYSFRASASCNPFVGQRETITCSGSFHVSGEKSNGNLEIQPTACNVSYFEY